MIILRLHVTKKKCTQSDIFALAVKSEIVFVLKQRFVWFCYDKVKFIFGAQTVLQKYWRKTNSNL